METINLASQTAPLSEDAPKITAESETLAEAPAAPQEELITFKDFLGKFRPSDWTLLVVLIALFSPTFYGLWVEYTYPEAPQAYGLLVLPASLGLAWMLRSRAKDVTPRPVIAGFGVSGAGLLATVFGTLIGSLTIASLGFCLTAAGIVWTRYGSEMARRFWFPLAFLLAIVPMPHEFMNAMTFQLQQLSVRWAGSLLKIFGDVSVEGTRIHMSNYTLDVIAPCSGMTIILPLVVLSAYYLSMITAPLWKKALLIALTVPVALIVNAVRIALIGIVGETISSKAAASFHDYSGLITVICGFAVLIFVAQEIKCNQISDEIAL